MLKKATFFLILTMIQATFASADLTPVLGTYNGKADDGVTACTLTLSKAVGLGCSGKPGKLVNADFETRSIHDSKVMEQGGCGILGMVPGGADSNQPDDNQNAEEADGFDAGPGYYAGYHLLGLMDGDYIGMEIDTNGKPIRAYYYHKGILQSPVLAHCQIQ